MVGKSPKNNWWSLYLLLTITCFRAINSCKSPDDTSYLLQTLLQSPLILFKCRKNFLYNFLVSVGNAAISAFWLSMSQSCSKPSPKSLSSHLAFFPLLLKTFFRFLVALFLVLLHLCSFVAEANRAGAWAMQVESKKWDNRGRNETRQCPALAKEKYKIEISEVANKLFLLDQTTALQAAAKDGFNIFRAVVFSINSGYFAFAMIWNLSDHHKAKSNNCVF